jgi:hypothetical protein
MKAYRCLKRYDLVVLSDGVYKRRTKNKEIQKIQLYLNLWNGIFGFLYDGRNIEKKVKDELREELGYRGERYYFNLSRISF